MIGPDLRQMRYFVAVCAVGSFTAAAKELFVAQQAVSQQIKALEAMVGVALLDRGPPVTPTAAGVTFLEQARALVAAADRLVEQTRAAGRGERGLVRFGYSKTAAFQTFPLLQGVVAEALPDVDLRGREVFGGDVVDLLTSDRLDVAAAPRTDMPDSIATLPLRDDALVAAVAADHPLAREESIDLTALRSETFLLWPREMSPGYYDAVVGACRSAGFEPEVDSAVAGSPVWANIAAGQGVILLVESERTLVPPGIAMVPLRGPDRAWVRVELLWRPAATTPALSRVLEVARKLAATNGWLT